MKLFVFVVVIVVAIRLIEKKNALIVLNEFPYMNYSLNTRLKKNDPT